MDFGNVTRNMSAVGAGNDVVVQVQARLLSTEHLLRNVSWYHFFFQPSEQSSPLRLQYAVV